MNVVEQHGHAIGNNPINIFKELEITSPKLTLKTANKTQLRTANEKEQDKSLTIVFLFVDHNKYQSLLEIQFEAKRCAG